ncbi:site-specific integrase [Rhodoferax sp.]|uniref:tyrosine-type recombinase/integrase n=1 Tax=Rhodoferax sp. TaxID=50421 RepID=UPI002602D22F|nr:site-specific integrase [Rhodoferax sp.]MDD5478485.1 site-specific integrase [Rhodoferax sp.]
MAKIKFTAGRVTGFTCPPDKAQAFLWDTEVKGLGLRATPNGKPTFIYQSEYQDKSVRLTIGNPGAWTIPQAQEKARQLQRLIDEGKDPRSLKADALAQSKAVAAEQARKAQQEAAQAVTVGDVWAAYIAERRPHWGERHYRDHLEKSRAGGEPFKRGTGTTEAGPLHSLMALPLRDLTAPLVEAWAAKQAQTRPTSARLAWRLLKVFLGWCTEQDAYAPLVVGSNAAKTKKTREALGKAGTKKDALQREQLPAWFAAVLQIGNPAIAAYLQALLLTGARPGELLALRWGDVNLNWKGLTIRDKVEGERVIPLTPYVHHLIAALPRRGEWVFAGAGDKSLTNPAKNLNDACRVAGVDHVSMHGLRRSFKSLTEWLEIPAGVVAQLMGHKPSATAEKHYTVRPLDLLRVHHEKIEAWILEQAGVTFDAAAEPGKLRVVAG